MADLIELVIPPDQAGYATADGIEVVSAKLDGGASRRRRDIIGATSTVNVAWTCNEAKYLYLRSFYRTVAGEGATPFNIGLLLDRPTITTHKAYFVPGSMQLQSQRGLTFVVAAQLEVYPIKTTQDDTDFVYFYNELGEDLGAIVDVAINVDYPLAIANV